MPHLRIREILDALYETVLTPRQNLLITELVATLLLASNARPASIQNDTFPTNGAKRAYEYRQRKRDAGVTKRDESVTKRDARHTDEVYILNNKTFSSEKVNKKQKTNTSAKAIPSRLRDDWEPSLALIEWARRKEYAAEFVAYETERFKNWAFGRGVTRSDWDACWRNWLMRNWEERKPQQRKSGMAEALDRVVERAKQHDARAGSQGNVVDLSEVRERGQVISGAPCDVESSSGDG